MKKEFSFHWPTAFCFLVALVNLMISDRTFAAGTVTVCDEGHLRAALVGGGLVTFAADGTITLTNTLVITNGTTIDASGHSVTISGNNAVRVFTVNSPLTFT